MFRPMRRKGQQLADNEAIEVLKNAKRGVLSVIGDNGWPYGMYLNPLYKDGKIYFHGARTGHRMDALHKDSRASFTVIDEGVKDEGGWAYTFKSVIVFGHIEFIDNKDDAIAICRHLARRFTSDERHIEDEIGKAGGHVQVIALVPEHITCKRIHEA